MSGYTYPHWSLSQKTAPSVEPVTLAEAKLHLRVDVTDDDTLITNLITAAREWAETHTNRAFITQTWYLKLDRFPCGTDPIMIPRPPAASIASITYVDVNGVTQTWAATTGYDFSAPSGPKAQVARVRPVFGAVYPIAKYQFDAVTVEYTCGYGLAVAVPGSIKAAILLMIGHLYENREQVLAAATGRGFFEAPMGVQTLLGPYMVQTW